MVRFRKYLPGFVAALIGAAAMAAPSQARADFIIRATDVSSGGTVTANVTQSGLSAPDGSGFLTFSSTVGNFSITVVTHISTTGPGFTSSSDTVNLTYNGPTGANSDKLIIEVLANMFSNPTAPASSQISSNASPSTSGLIGGSVVMTSGVLAGNVSALNAESNGGAPAAALSGQLGMTTGNGSLGSASSVLTPNPVGGAVFSIVNPFSFYQTYTFSDFTNSAKAGSLSAGSTVAAVPAPAGLVLALTGLPVFGAGWLRRRRALQTM